MKSQARKAVTCSVAAAVLVAAWALAAFGQNTDDAVVNRLRREIADRARQLRDTSDEAYRDRLRREITDRSRQLRDARDAQSQTRGGNANDTNTFGIDLNNPFGTGMDFAADAWENARQGNFELFGGAGGGSSGKKNRQQVSQPLDLNGRPLSPIQTTRVRATPASPVPANSTAPATQADPASLAEATSRTIKAAELLFNNREYGAARRMLTPIAASRKRAPDEVDAAKKFIERIDTLGMKQLLEADQLAEAGDTDKAAVAYEDIARRFGSAPAAKLAGDKLAVLKEQPEVAAQFLMQRAQAALDQRRPDVAIAVLREIVKRYKATSVAGDAQAMLDKLEKTAAADAALTEDQVLAARKWLIIGDIQAANGRTDEAADSYHRVVREFEDSKYADQARSKLGELEKR